MRTSNALLLGGLAAAAVFVVIHVGLAKGQISLPVELSGERTTERYDLPALQHLNFEGPVRLILTAGLPSVTIEADRVLQAELKDRDDDPATLSIVVPESAHHLGTNDMIVARVSTPDLRSVSVSGRAEVSSTAPLSFRSVLLNLHGSPRVDLAFVQLDSLQVKGSGSVNGSLSGRATSFLYEVSGSSELDASALISSLVSAEMNGSSNLKVHADSLLTVKGNGSTEVTYRGDARVRSEINGSGSVERIE